MEKHCSTTGIRYIESEIRVESIVVCFVVKKDSCTISGSIVSENAFKLVIIYLINEKYCSPTSSFSMIIIKLRGKCAV